MQNTDHDALDLDPQFGNEQEWMARGFMRRELPVAITPPAAEQPDAADARFWARWVDQERVSTYPADPAYPHGAAIDVALDAAHACRLALPSPTVGCGLWVIKCRRCHYALCVGTAGRPDDPCSVRIPCKSPPAAWT